MKILSSLLVAFAASFCLCSLTVAQDSESELAEAIEALVENLGEDGGEVGESIEEAIDKYSGELEEWAEKYSSDWEKWAEKFEKRMNRWAEDQEDIWEDWADAYGKKWERWAEELEGTEWDAEEVNEVIQKNLEMLGKMPLGELVEGVMKEGTKSFESAPWESLQDLQGMLQESIKRSVEETERRLARQTEKNRRSKSKVDDVTEEMDLILPVIEEQQKSLKVKEKALSKEAAATLGLIKEKLAAGKTSRKDVEKLLELMNEQNQKRAELKNRFKKYRSQQIESAVKQKKLAEQTRMKSEERLKQVLEARKSAERKLAAERNTKRAMLEFEKAAQNQKSAEEEALKSIILEKLEAEERKIQDKNDELEILRREVQRLKEEVRKLSKDRG